MLRDITNTIEQTGRASSPSNSAKRAGSPPNKTIRAASPSYETSQRNRRYPHLLQTGQTPVVRVTETAKPAPTAPNMALLVDRLRPRTLEALTYHHDLSARLKALVRLQEG